MQFTTVSILSALTALAAADQHRYPTIWHVTDLQAGCRNEATSQECSYLFNIVGDESYATPGFKAQCRSLSLQGDNTFRNCYLTSTSGDLKVDEVTAYVSQERDSNTELKVELKFIDKDNNPQWWSANKIDKYDEFVKTKKFDIIPTFEKSTSK